jgi:hypothetical protein
MRQRFQLKGIMMCSRSGRRTTSVNVRSGLVLLWAGVGCLVLAGCSEGPPSVTLNTAAGQTPINTPSAGRPGGLATSPQSGAPAAPAPSGPIDRSGTYAGTAVPLDTGGGLCVTTRKVSGFTVRGKSVRFGSFRGTIDANNGVQMFAGQQWIVGQFEGAIFSGQLDMTAQGTSRRDRSAARGCSYVLNLERVGPS